MIWKGKKVLVTGADGFIGSHLVEALVERGANVRAFCFYNSFNTWGWLDTLDSNVLDSVDIFTGDIRDPNGVTVAMENIAVVFHLAALIGIPFSYHSPDSYVDTNIKGTLNVLQSARKLDVEKIVHTSTSEVYGTAQHVPISEEHPIVPQSPYAATKSAADELALSFFRSFDLPVSVLRPFNTYGPRQSARAVIPTIASQIFSGADQVRLGNLDATRDLNYVDNTVEAFIAIAETDSTIGQVYNSGSGKEVSIRALVAMLQETIGREVDIVVEEKRLRPAKSEVERLLGDATKLTRECGWRPVINLREGLERTCKWIESNPHAFKQKIYNI